MNVPHEAVDAVDLVLNGTVRRQKLLAGALDRDELYDQLHELHAAMGADSALTACTLAAIRPP